MLKTYRIPAVLAATIIALALIGILLFALLERPGPDTKDKIVLAHDKGAMPAFQQSFARQADKAAEAAGYGFDPVASETTDLFISQMKASLPTRDAPEMFVWWAGERVRQLVENELVIDITHLWDKHAGDYPASIRKAYTMDGKVYGFPYSIEYWPVWYNKPLFERLDIKVPETWPEFIRACEVLKAHSIPPVLSSLQHKWYAFVWFEELLIGEDPDFYERLCRGKARYDAPQVRKAFALWGDMIRKEYFTEPGAHMFTNAGHMWHTEQFGMVLCGSWYYSTVLLPQGVKAADIGSFILPSHNADAGRNIVMESGPVFTARNAKRKEAAEKIVDWWMGPEGSRHFARIFKTYSANRHVGAGHLPAAKRRIDRMIKARNYRILNRYWEAAPTPVVRRAIDLFARFILNPDEVDPVIRGLVAAAEAARLDKRADKNRGLAHE